MRNQPLRSLIENLRKRARLSTNPSRGVDDRDSLVALINAYYLTYAQMHQWEFLKAHREDCRKALQAGERYYDFPVVIDSTDALSTQAFVKRSGVWTPLAYGISLSGHYNARDSDLDDRDSMPTNWELRDGDQFEIWPIPDDNDMEVGFDGGQRKVTPLVADNDKCLLDDWMIVNSAAGEILAANKQADAEIVARQGAMLFAKLSGKASGNERVQVGIGPMTGGELYPGGPGYPRIIVASSRQS